MNKNNAFSICLRRLKVLARNGNAELAWLIGEGYLDGCIYFQDGEIPVRKNRRAAERWLRIASELGNGNAMLALASVIAGEGERYREAFAWERKAMALGVPFAVYDAAITASMMGKRKKSYHLLMCAYRQHPSETSLLLGVCLYAGYGCRRDMELAEKYFLQGAASSENLDEDRVSALFYVSAIRHGVPFAVRGHIGEAHPERIFDEFSATLFRSFMQNVLLSFPARKALEETLKHMGQPYVSSNEKEQGGSNDS